MKDRNRKDIIERVKQLLALADTRRNDNINEAAAAAKLAYKLMAEHRLRQFELREGDRAAPPPAPFERRDLMARLGHSRVTDWRFNLLVDVAESYRCRTVAVWGEDGSMEIFGRPSDLDAVSYTFFYLVREVERQVRRLGRTCRKRLPAARRRWFRDARLGMVEAVGRRLRNQRAGEERRLGLQPGMGTRFLAHLDRERQALDRFVASAHPDLEDETDTFEADDVAWRAGVKQGRGVDLGRRKAPGLGQATRLLPKKAAG